MFHIDCQFDLTTVWQTFGTCQWSHVLPELWQCRRTPTWLYRGCCVHVHSSSQRKTSLCLLQPKTGHKTNCSSSRIYVLTVYVCVKQFILPWQGLWAILSPIRCDCHTPECSLHTLLLYDCWCWDQHREPTKISENTFSAKYPQQVFCYTWQITQNVCKRYRGWWLLDLHCESQYLVIVILWGTARIKTKVQTAGPWDVYRLLELVIVPHRVHRLYCLPSSPWGRDLQPSQETRLLPFVKNSNIKDTNKILVLENRVCERQNSCH